MATFAALWRQLAGWADAGAVGTPAKADEFGNLQSTSVDALTAAALPVGPTNATSVDIGKAAVPARAATGATAGFDCQTAAPVTVGGNVATAVVLGKAGVANGNGVRNAASRNIIENKPTAPVDIAGGITATVTQLLEAGIFLCSASATLTLPTAQGASGIVQALPGAAVGDLISFVQVVAAAQTATLAAGTGSTLAGIATTAAATTGRRWIGRITSVTANSETITWY
jgi:hypothetical protein